MSNETVISAANARHRVMPRFRGLDPTTYTTTVPKRWDMKYGVAHMANEIVANAERDAVGRAVRVKNTSGGTYAKGTLIGLATAALTPQTTGTASSSPAKGTGVVITIAGSWQVGMEVSIVSGGYIDYALVTAQGGGTITVDILLYDHTTPVVTALPAYEISLADADGAAPAEWVLSAAILTGEYGYAFDCFEVTGLDTSAFTAEALLYLSATAGTYTATAPTGIDQIQQVVGIVKTSHATTGSILFIPGVKRILKYGSSFLQSGLAITDGDKGDITVSASGATWTIDAGVVTYAKIQNIAGLSVMGRASNSSGVGADITAGSDLQIMRRSGTSIGFGSIDLSSSSAVGASVLTVTNGGTGAATFTSKGILYGNGTGAILVTAAPTAGQVMIANATPTPAFQTVTGDVTFTSGGVTAIGANKVADSMIRQGTARTVIGRSANSTGNVADISGAAGKLLGDRGSALAFIYPQQALSKSSGHTVVADDNGAVISCDASGGAFTLTLTAAATLGSGFTFTAVKTDSSANGVTIDANASETINGALTNKILAQYGHVTLFCTGSAWLVLDANDFIEVTSLGTSFPTSGNWGDGASITLTPGEWMISMVIEAYIAGATTFTYYRNGVSTTSGNSATGLSSGVNLFQDVGPPTGASASFSLADYRVVPTADTTYYQKVLASWSGGTAPTFYARMTAKRVG